MHRCPPASAPTQINSEHGSKALFMQQVSKCIFTNCPDDLINLNKARETAGFKSNGAKEKRSDRQTYVRRVIRKPEEVVAKLQLLVEQHLLEEEENRKRVQLAADRKRRAKKKEDKAHAKVLEL